MGAVSLFCYTRKMPRNRSRPITPGTPRVTEMRAVALLSAIETPVEPESRLTAPSPAMPQRAEIILVRTGCFALVAAADTASNAVIPIKIPMFSGVIFSHLSRCPPSLRPSCAQATVF